MLTAAKEAKKAFNIGFLDHKIFHIVIWLLNVVHEKSHHINYIVLSKTHPKCRNKAKMGHSNIWDEF